MPIAIDVKDIETVPFEKTLCLDANVLYFLYFPGFRTLRRYANHDNLPPTSLIDQYTSWVGRSVENGCKLVTSFMTAYEFLTTIEHAVLERDYLVSGGQVFRGSIKKQQRLRSPNSRDEIYHYFRNLRKKIELIPHSNFQKVPERSIDLWFKTKADVRDACLVEHGKRFNVDMFVSDDVDFLEFEGITVCTANSNILGEC